MQSAARVPGLLASDQAARAGVGLRGARGLRGLLWGRVGSGPGWHCAEGAWLCLQLLGKRREHAEVGKVLDVIVAGPLGGIPGHGQHVLQEGTEESHRAVSTLSQGPGLPPPPQGPASDGAAQDVPQPSEGHSGTLPSGKAAAVGSTAPGHNLVPGKLGQDPGGMRGWLAGGAA